MSVEIALGSDAISINVQLIVILCCRDICTMHRVHTEQDIEILKENNNVDPSLA